MLTMANNHIEDKDPKITIHAKEIELDKNKLAEILDRRGMEYMDLYDKVVEKYGLDIKYKAFMSQLSNRSSWKLLYAHAIADVLMINYNEIFKIVNVNVEEKLKEKEIWKEKYEKGRKPRRRRQ